MDKAPAFQFYAKDWLSSPKIALMPPEYEGAYIRLLAYCWDSGDCSLPDDDGELAALSRLGQGWLKGGAAVLRKCFVPHPAKPGYLTNQRLLDELAKQLAWRQKSSSGGKKSAAQRAEKKQESKGGSTNMQPKHRTPLQPNVNSSSSSSTDSGTKVSSSTALPEWLPASLWHDYLEMRRKKRATPTERAKELLIAKLTEWRAKGHDPAEILSKSITSNWTDIFEPKEQTHGKQCKPSTIDILAEATRQARALREQNRAESPG